jgi:hypothetical protein
VSNDLRVEGCSDILIACRMVSVIVSVDDVVHFEIVVLHSLLYRVGIETRIDYRRFSRSVICDDVREVVAPVLDLFEEHEDQPKLMPIS